jgi:hypothetical protein
MAPSAAAPTAACICPSAVELPAAVLIRRPA